MTPAQIVKRSLEIAGDLCIYTNQQHTVEDLEHRAAGLDDAIGGESFAEEVIAGDGGVGQVDVGEVVDDLAIDLLGDALIEAAVAGF